MDNLPAEAACEIIEVYCLISPQLPSLHCRGERAINREKQTNASLVQVLSSGRRWGVCEEGVGVKMIEPGECRSGVMWHLAGEPPGGLAVRRSDSQLSESQVKLQQTEGITPNSHLV